MNRPVLQTTRLTLRPLELRDAPHLRRLVDDPEIFRNTLRIPHPYPEGAAEEFIGRNQKQLEEKDEVALAVVVRDTDEFIGIIGMVPKPFDVGEIGYWLGRPYWNRGYASEAATAMVRYGFEERTFNRIDAVVFAHNAASARVLEKSGMTLEGVLRQFIRKGDQYLDARMYSVLRSEFQR
jgi:RimJ/RimL family protein N-acetyltransferase